MSYPVPDFENERVYFIDHDDEGKPIYYYAALYKDYEKTRNHKKCPSCDGPMAKDHSDYVCENCR